MSSFTRKTKHPVTGRIQQADWIDDYFGPHEYGIKFPDGKVFTQKEVKDCTYPITACNSEKTHGVGCPMREDK